MSIRIKNDRRGLDLRFGIALALLITIVTLIGCGEPDEVAQITLFGAPAPASHSTHERAPSEESVERAAEPSADMSSEEPPDVVNLPDDDTPDRAPDEAEVSAEEEPADTQEQVTEEDASDTSESRYVNLRLYPLDIWGTSIHNAVLMVRDPDGRRISWTRKGFPLRSEGTYTVELTAPDHHSAVIELTHLRDDEVNHLNAEFPEHADFGWILSRDEETSSAHLVIGLKHRWFAASGPPARRGGSIEFLMDGEHAWRRVHERLLRAQDSIHISTWWWGSDFELTRDQVLGTRAERRPNTIMSILEESPATKRIMVWDNPLLRNFNVDGPLLDHADRNDDIEYLGVDNSVRDGFWWSMPNVDFSSRVRELTRDLGEVLQIGSPAESNLEERWVDMTDLPIDMDLPHASYHQKYMVLDGQEAFIGGMNLKSTDWDTSAHRVFEPRRMEFTASERARTAVSNHQRSSDTVPRKDYMVRVTGPIVHDVGQTFSSVWNLQRETLRPYTENSTPTAPPIIEGLNPRGVPMQLVHTMPAPHTEYSILESHLNAVQNAQDYILIEDQYWRTPILVDAIIERMTVTPDLELIVITNPVSEWTDPGCYWTHATHQQLRTRFPDRYRVAQLKSFATSADFGFDEVAGHFEEVFIHSKLMIVDDHFLTIGSCNTNNRGFLYEYEMNINVLHREFVSAVRQAVISNLLGFEQTPDDSSEWIQLLGEVIDWNQWVESWWADQGHDISLNGSPLPEENTPIGFAYPLSFGEPRACALEGIGADITQH